MKENFYHMFGVIFTIVANASREEWSRGMESSPEIEEWLSEPSLESTSRKHFKKEIELEKMIWQVLMRGNLDLRIHTHWFLVHLFMHNLITIFFFKLFELPYKSWKEG